MRPYEDSVFINVPFDRKYARLGDAIIFAVYDCGFVCRSALEIDDSGQARVDKILDIIQQSKFGIHDISRAGIDRNTRLARFNMPLELGFFLGAKRYGNERDREKRCLILDRSPYRYAVSVRTFRDRTFESTTDQPRDAILAVAEVVERRAGHGGLQHLADALRGDAERAGAILVDDQLHRRHRLEPIVMDGAKQRILRGTSP